MLINLAHIGSKSPTAYPDEIPLGSSLDLWNAQYHWAFHFQSRNHALSESRAWWRLPQPPRQRLSWRSKNHCHSHYQSLSISTNLDSMRSIWCPILGSPLADLAAVPTSISSIILQSFSDLFPNPKVPHCRIGLFLKRRHAWSVKHCETLHKPYGRYGHGVWTWPTITVSGPWELHRFFQREDLLTWHEIHKFCCANVGRFSHSSSGNNCLLLVCHVSSKYLNNRHFSQCKWNKWLSLTKYMHQNCNIASSNLLMNNYGVSQFLGPDPDDMYKPHLVERQLMRQEWLKHDFRFTL